MESNAILETVNSIIFGSHGVWFLIGAALVYFMQAGFAMCEAGFTRAKNVGNIIMKNLMDFCLGTVAFIFVGYNVLNSLLIVFTVLSSVCLSIQSKHTGYGAAQHG